MRNFESLLRESFSGHPLERKISPRFEMADLVTFAQNKRTPIYNWLYYKEGFSRDFVWKTLEELEIPKGSLVLDPFCGTGTALLAAQQAGYASAGFDILPLGVFASRVKLEEDYDLERLEREVKRVSSLKFEKPHGKLVDVRFIDMRKAFNPYARDDVLFFKENIMDVEDVKIRNFLLLGLISIVGQASNTMKDGGVLRVVGKKHLPPVKHLLRSRLKRMLKDVRERERTGASWSVQQGDARNLPLEDASVDSLITSPPYLNFVDYTKIYALELSLLVSSTRELEELGRKSLRSHISAEYHNGKEGIELAMERVREANPHTPLPVIVEGYLKDLALVISETARVMKKNGCAVFVIGNAALPDVTVDADVLLAELGEQAGFAVRDVWVANVRWAKVHGIAKPRPVRESAVVLERD